jgi:hypothetical protein
VTTSIPLWVPLVVAILGLIGTAGGTIAGVMITQRRTDARDRAAWERERERWAHEDAAHTFDLRREAYIEFYAAANAKVSDIIRSKGHLRRGWLMKPTRIREQSGDIDLAVMSALEKVCIYGSDIVVRTAEMMQEHLVRSGLYNGESIAKDLEELQDSEHYLLSVIRVDLGIPVDEI